MSFLFKKSTKKIYACLLVISMLLGTLPGLISVKADASGWQEGGDGSYQNFNGGETGVTDQMAEGIKLTKKISRFDPATGEYTVDLRVDGASTTNMETKVDPMDIVLVIDRSGSMYYGSRMDNAKKAAIDFINEVDKVNEEAYQKTGKKPIQVGIVSYADTSTENQTLTNDKVLLQKSIRQLNAYGGTFTQDGLMQANSMLSASTNRKVIILISDGEPTFAYKNEIKEKNEDWPAYNNDIKLGYEIWYKDGSKYSVGYKADRSNFYMSIQYRTNTKIGLGNGMTQEVRYNTIHEALIIQKNIDNLYSIGIGATSNSAEENVLKAVANEGNYFRSDNYAANLGNILKDILKEETTTNHCINNGMIEDVLSQYVDYLSGSAKIIVLKAENACKNTLGQENTIAKTSNDLVLDVGSSKITVTGNRMKNLILDKGDYIEVQYKVKLKENWKDGMWHDAGGDNNAAVFYPDKNIPDKIAFANPWVKQLVKFDLEITKKWMDREHEDERPGNIKIRLIAGNTIYTINAEKGQPTMVLLGGEKTDIKATTAQDNNDPDQWNIKVKNLPKYSDGEEINYIIKEEELKGYTGTVDNTTITNELRKTKVSVTKVWNDADDREKKRPDHITFTLKSDHKTYTVKAGSNTNEITLNGQPVEEVSVTTEIQNNQWIITIDGLKQYAKNGEPIVYSVDKEDPIDGYAQGVIDKNTITNTLQYKTIMRDIKVRKIWKVGDASAYKADVKVGLRATGQTIEPKEIKADAVDNSVSFTVRKYDDQGSEIDYRPYEEEFQNKNMFKQEDIKGSMEDGFTITNELDFEKLKDNLKITVKKEWKNLISGLNIPAEIKVKINSSVQGTEPIELTLNEAEGWSATTDILAKYDSEGRLITYTIEEVSVPGFKLQGQPGLVKGDPKQIGTEPITRTLTNIPKNSEDGQEIKIAIKKVDAQNVDQGLSGAVFNIRSLDEQLQETNMFNKEVTSKKDGMIEDISLPATGIYRIKEIKAPQGYMGSEPLYIKIEQENNIVKFFTREKTPVAGNDEYVWKLVEMGEGQSVPVFMIRNTKLKDNTIYKIDDSENPLQGAKFDLYKRVTENGANTIWAEVDNSEITGEDIFVKARLYSHKPDQEEDQSLGEKTLTTSKLNDVLKEKIVPKEGEQFYVEFTFSKKFKEDGIRFDNTRNTFVLKLVKNPDPQPDSAKDPEPTDDTTIQEPTNTETESMITTLVSSKSFFTAPQEITNPEEGAGKDEPEAEEVISNEEEEPPAEQGTQQEGEQPSSGNEEFPNEDGQQTDNKEKSEEETISNTEKIDETQPPTATSISVTDDTTTVKSEPISLPSEGFVKYLEELISKDGGVIDLPGLPDGSYYLAETGVPSALGGHYEPETEKLRFEISESIIRTWNGDLEEGFKWLEKKELNDPVAQGTIYTITNRWVIDKPNDPAVDPNPDPDPVIDPQPIDDNNNATATIDDDRTPLTVPKEIEDEPVVLETAKEPEEIIEEEVPLADIPKTSGSERAISVETMILLTATAVTGTLLAVYTLRSKKYDKKEQE